MSRIFSKYKEKFAPNAQTDLMSIIKSDEQMFQDYKKFFGREKMEGICRYLCEYVTLKDLLVNKESFVKAIEKKRLLVGDLIRQVKDNNIAPDKGNIEKPCNIWSKVEISLKKQRKKGKDIIKRLKGDKQRDFLERFRQMKERAESCKLTMKKPKTLTAADLNLAAMNQNSYMEISYGYMNDKHVGHDTNDERAWHAVLIKKNSDNSFAFYDPNFGAVFDLTEEQLCEVVTQSFYEYKDSYERISKLGIVVLFTLPILIVAGIFAAVYGCNIIASVSFTICLVGLLDSCHLREKTVSQYYDTIQLTSVLLTLYEGLEIELDKLEEEYFGSYGKSENAAISSEAQVENITKGEIAASASN